MGNGLEVGFRTWRSRDLLTEQMDASSAASVRPEIPVFSHRDPNVGPNGRSSRLRGRVMRRHPEFVTRGPFSTRRHGVEGGDGDNKPSVRGREVVRPVNGGRAVFEVSIFRRRRLVLPFG